MRRSGSGLTYELAWLNLDSTQCNTKAFKDAAEAYRWGLALLPDEAEAWVRLARCLWVLGEAPGETAVLEIALRYHPMDLHGWLELGLARAKLGHRAEAQAILQRLRSAGSPGRAVGPGPANPAHRR